VRRRGGLLGEQKAGAGYRRNRTGVEQAAHVPRIGDTARSEPLAADP
jgi:hypothetical protein